MSGFRDHLPPLISRFPTPVWRRSADAEWSSDWPLASSAETDKQAHDYPALAPDLAFWHDNLAAKFRRMDHNAQILQNQFWRQNVTLILGGVIATTLGAVQAALGGHMAGVAIAQVVLTGVLIGLTVVIRSRRAQQGYFTSRLKAEQIKSEFFLFLARAGDYSGEDRREVLLHRVKSIELAEGTG